MTNDYQNPGPLRQEIDNTSGPLVLEFGVDWCPHCQAAQPLIKEALAPFSAVSHLKVEDGKGRRLGRSFHVKLWPTFIFLKDGIEIARSVRPLSLHELSDGLTAISSPS